MVFEIFKRFMLITCIIGTRITNAKHTRQGMIRIEKAVDKYLLYK